MPEFPHFSSSFDKIYSSMFPRCIYLIIWDYEISWEAAVGPVRSAHLDLYRCEIFTWSYLAPAKWGVPVFHNWNVLLYGLLNSG